MVTIKLAANMPAFIIVELGMTRRSSLISGICKGSRGVTGLVNSY